MTVSINGTSGLVFNDASTQATAATGFGFKNRIINGAMMIDQRNAGASVTPASGTYNNFCVDRFPFSTDGGGGRITAQQSTTVPAGFSNSLSLTVQTVDSSIGSGDQYWLEQRIEGNNVADMGFGTANASTFTLSFWVRSSVTGTYAVSFRSTAGSARSYVATYVINAANTWEQKTITVAGDTSGTWATNTSTGLQVLFDLGSGSNFQGTAGSWQTANLYRTSGSVNWISNSGATFYITGVQLEKGSTATSFDYRPYGTELALCQRYYAETTNDAVYAIVAQGQWNGSVASAVALYPQEMRAVPTVTALGTNAGSWYVQQGQTGISTGSTTFANSWGGATNRRSAWLDFSNLSGGVSNAALTVMRNNQSTSNRNGCLSFNAEL
jgi:hypothetical protein